jgi:hypothetical protein
VREDFANRASQATKCRHRGRRPCACAGSEWRCPRRRPSSSGPFSFPPPPWLPLPVRAALPRTAVGARSETVADVRVRVCVWAALYASTSGPMPSSLLRNAAHAWGIARSVVGPYVTPKGFTATQITDRIYLGVCVRARARPASEDDDVTPRMAQETLATRSMLKSCASGPSRTFSPP